MIYLDNHATTRCDPRVVDAMLPWLSEHFGNPHSDSHAMGRNAASAISDARESMAAHLGVPADALVFTSGATESNWLAIRGVCTHPRQKRRKIVMPASEHPAVLDVGAELGKEGFDVVTLGLRSDGSLDLAECEQAIDDDTALVSVMAANNEIGIIHPLDRIAEIAHAAGALVHSDATQAVGRMDVDACSLDVDLISGSAHKFYGPKGIGFLTVGNGNRRVRLRPLVTGGGQQRGRRGGTMNPAGVVAMATALQLCGEETQQRQRLAGLRNRLWERLAEAIDDLHLNGPPLDGGDRLEGNLNVQLPGIEGEAWMAATPGVAFSSGSACSSVDPAPSHVLLAMGMSESEARRSVRFGVGRFNTEEEIDSAAGQLIGAYRSLS